MKLKLIYNKKYDTACKKRYADFLDRNGTVWGVSRQQSPVSIQSAEIVVDMGDIYDKYVCVFDIKPEILGYIVSTPFSMINDDGRFNPKTGKIFFSPFTNAPQKVLAHEMFHVFFEKITERKIPNYETSKEFFTVIMNHVIAPGVSPGYPEHEKERGEIEKIWAETKNIRETIKIFFSEN